MIIALGYQARVGKDSVGGRLVRHHGFTRLAFADKLKELALKSNPLIGEHGHLQSVVGLDGWEATKRGFPESRLYLQHLGVACREVFGNQVWINPIVNEIYENPRSDFVVTDLRFRNEAIELKRLEEYLPGQRVFTVNVTRPGHGALNGHQSETEMTHHPFDYVLDNAGTLDDLDGLTDLMVKVLRAR